MDSRLASYSLLLSSLLFTSPLYAGTYFIGADKTLLSGYIKWDTAKPHFDLAPIRVKAGYQGDLFGVEFHAFSEQEDTTNDSGFLFDFTMHQSYGAYFRVQQEWAYARLGATWIDTTLDVTSAKGQFATSSDMVAALTFAIGAEYSITKNLSFNLDYTYAEGKVRYPTITAKGPGLTDPTLRLQGMALGLNLKF